MRIIITLLTLFMLNSTIAQITEPLNNDSIRISKIESKLDSKIDAKLSTIDRDFSQNLLQQYKALNDTYGFFITLLLAIFGIIFPLSMYFIQIKPAQEALKEAKILQSKLEENFEQSFEAHHSKKISKIIDEAITSFENLDDQVLSTSYTNLDTYKTETFSNNQIKRIIALLNRIDIDNDNKQHFARILTFQNSIEIENYFVELLTSDPENKLCIWGALYFATNKKPEYNDLIADVVIKGYSITGMFASLKSHTKNFAYEFLNNKKLVENLQDYKINSFCEFVSRDKYDKVDYMNIQKSLLWRKYIELKN